MRLLLAAEEAAGIQVLRGLLRAEQAPVAVMARERPEAAGASTWAAARHAGLETCRHFAGMGIEPLSNALNEDYLAARARGRTTDLKAFLLDQRHIAGLGNIYVCEALYRARLSPRPGENSDTASRTLVFPAPFGPDNTTGRPSSSRPATLCERKCDSVSSVRQSATAGPFYDLEKLESASGIRRASA